MEEQFVTYEIALKLKELGFDEEVIATFDTDENNELRIFAFSVPDKGIFEIGFNKGWCIKAPLWQQVVDWLREKHNINVSINYSTYLNLFNGIIVTNKRFQSWHNKYEDARKYTILKALELIK